jgi:hypothetical protein
LKYKNYKQNVINKNSENIKKTEHYQVGVASGRQGWLKIKKQKTKKNPKTQPDASGSHL